MTKIKAPKPWNFAVNLDRLDAATGHWRVTTGKTSDPLPREVAKDPAVWGAIVAWMNAHRARTKPSPDESEQLSASIRTSVTAAFRALQPKVAVPVPATAAVAAAAPRKR